MESAESELSRRSSTGPSHGVSFREALGVWVKIALYSFGGPTGQIAVMHRLLVEEKRWVSEERFLHALNYCMLLPGPEAQQLAPYTGWLLHGIRGGVVAGTLFVLPGFLSILALSILYAGFQKVSAVQGLFYDLKPAVVAVVAAAGIRIAGRTLKSRTRVGLAFGAFVAIFFLEVPFPWIVAAAGLAGYLAARLSPVPASSPVPEAGDDSSRGAGSPALEDRLPGQRPPLARSLQVLAICLALWWGPGPGNPSG